MDIGEIETIVTIPEPANVPNFAPESEPQRVEEPDLVPA